MKNPLSFLLLSILLFASASNVSARNFISFSENSIATHDTEAVAAPSGAHLRLNEVNIRAVRHFEKQFHSSVEKWYKLDDGLVAVFYNHAVNNRVYYDEQGRFLFTVKNYEEKDMPADVRTMIRNRYLGYIINLVTEIISDDRTIYQVHLKDRHSVKTVQVWDKQMTLTEDYLNAEL